MRPAPPSGPTFSQLHAELWQWERSLGEQAALLRLSADLDEGAPNVSAREVSWQQSSGRFLQRLGHTFADFDDFVTPVQLAVYEVKHGLRLQAAACASTAVAARTAPPLAPRPPSRTRPRARSSPFRSGR